jgi:hypothetical protein
VFELKRPFFFPITSPIMPFPITSPIMPVSTIPGHDDAMILSSCQSTRVDAALLLGLDSHGTGKGTGKGLLQYKAEKAERDHSKGTGKAERDHRSAMAWMMRTRVFELKRLFSFFLDLTHLSMEDRRSRFDLHRLMALSTSSSRRRPYWAPVLSLGLMMLCRTRRAGRPSAGLLGQAGPSRYAGQQPAATLHEMLMGGPPYTRS